MATSKSELEIFLEDLSVFFPISSTRNKDEVISQYADFLMEKSQYKDYKFSTVKKWIINNYTKSSFPEVTFIRDALKQGEIRNIKTSAHDGELIVVTLPNGQKYSFVVSAYGTKSMTDIKEDIKRRYEEYPDVKVYPKGSVLIGNEVFINEEETGSKCN